MRRRPALGLWLRLRGARRHPLTVRLVGLLVRSVPTTVQGNTMTIRGA